MDLAGARLLDFAGDVVKFVRRASDTCNTHYPGRNVLMVIVNAPYWFNVIWKFMKAFVPTHILEQVRVVQGTEKEIKQVLSESINVENIPPEYGGTSVPLGGSPEERMLANLMMQNNLHLSSDA